MKAKDAILKFYFLIKTKVYLRVKDDADFSNLPTKHPEAGLSLFFVNDDDRVSLVPWHSSHAPCRGHPMEHIVIMALESALTCSEKNYEMTNSLLEADVAVVVCIT